MQFTAREPTTFPDRRPGSLFWCVISFAKIICLSFIITLLGRSWGRRWKFGRKIAMAVITALFLTSSSVTQTKRDYSAVEVAYKKENGEQ